MLVFIYQNIRAIRKILKKPRWIIELAWIRP